MWHSMKRWRDWAMSELRPLIRPGPQSQALHVAYEKAGLTLHDAAVAWNADAVVVEASLRLPPPARRKSDFQLRLPEGDPVVPESLRAEDADRHRLFFRLPPPARGVTAALFWKDHLLGQVTVPVLSADEFLSSLRVEMPTIFVRLGARQAACQTFVATQGKGFQAAAVIASRSASLAPLADLGLKVCFRHERDGAGQDVPVPLCGSQLQGRQALITATP